MRVLQALMEQMQGLHESQGVPVLHYSQLGAGAMEQPRFGLHASNLHDTAPCASASMPRRWTNIA